ncbi:MAG: hypothetical protein H0W15_09620 [Gemmatimonadales bacterium]|nr:hypothetical protein [Gemmatimonadales bacterium]
MSHLRACFIALQLVVAAPAVVGAQSVPDTAAAWAAWAQAPADGLTDPSAAAALLPVKLRTAARLQPQGLSATLDTAASLRYGWAYRSPWGGFALARALQSEHSSCGPIEDVTTKAFLFWCRRAFAGYLRSLELDSAFAPTIADLDQIVPYPRVWADASYELAAVSGALARGSLPTDVRVRLERLQLLLTMERGSPAEARALLAGVVPGVVTDGERTYFEAFLLAAVGSPEAATRTYARASAVMGKGEHVGWVLRDIAWVGGTADSTTFTALPVDQRQSWVEAFWLDRDFDDGNAAGSRLVEHARRWRIALDRYRMFDAEYLLGTDMAALGAVFDACVAEGGTPDGVEVTPFCVAGGRDLPTIVIDDRGMTYLRHGEAQQLAKYPGIQSLRADTWLYTLRERPALVHFAVLLPGLPPGMFFSPLAYGDWMATCELAALYCVLDARRTLKSLSPERVTRVKELTIQDERFLASTDGAVQRFDSKLQMAANAIGLGSRPGVATMVADVSLRDLVARATDDPTRLALRWQVRIRNAANEWVVSLDTIRRYRLPPAPKGVPADAYLTVMLEVPVPAGTHDVKLVLSDTTGRIGAEYFRAGVVVEERSATVGLSDLILLPDGEQGAAATIEGTPIRLSPALTPGRAKFIGIGYILTGAAGRDVPVSVTVTEVGKERDAPAVQVAFVDRPQSARDFRTQRVGIAELKKGVYTLQLSAEVEPGSRLVRRQVLVVR